MMNSMDMNAQASRRRGSTLTPILIGCGAFAVGAVLTFGYVQWKSQQQQLALMTQMVQQIGQAQSVQPAVVDTATRNAPLDLLSVTAQNQVQVVPAAAAVVAPAATSAAVETTADKIRALVSRSSDPLVSAALAQDTARRETMSVAIKGVSELVDAAVAGNYALSADEDATGAARLSISFRGHEEDQAQLERLLASAASAGMIAYHDSVRSSDGSFNGEIILYDLVERALVNGSPLERRTGEALRQDALALLGQSNNAVVAEPVNSAGERFYTVESGDSLAFIALQFYGNTNDFNRIFQANRNILSSPEKIQIGQRLLIPNA